MKKFWLLAAGFASVFLSAAEVRLASGGKTDYTVVSAMEKPTDDEKAAAEDLCKYLTKITGAKFELNGDAPHKIYIGRKSPSDNKPLATYERRSRAENGDVYIYGNGRQGNAFAVYDFLEKFFGCRWYTFYGDEYIPEKLEAVFADLDMNLIPSFDFFLYDGGGAGKLYDAGDAFRRRARIHDFRLQESAPLPRLGSSGSHTPSRYIPSGQVPYGGHRPVAGPLKYFKDKKYFETNPEFFSLNYKGERDWRQQLCYSNPELRKELIKNYLIVAENEYKGGPARIIVDMNDKGKAGVPVCYCRECEKLNRKYGSPAGSFWDFFFEIAMVFKEKYPEIQLQTSAYQIARDVPDHMPKLPENSVLNIAPLDETDFMKPYEVNSPAACDMLESWSKVVGGKLSWWIYPSVYPRPLWTFPLVANIDRMVKNLRYLHKLGVNEIIGQFGCAADDDTGFNELLVYLISNLTRDINADVPALKRDFMEHYYGAAAPAMMKYLSELEEHEKNEKNFLRWWPDHRSALSYLTPEKLLKWEKDFAAMEELTKDDPKANMHVRRARLNLDEALMSIWYKFPGGKLPDREALHENYLKALHDGCADRVATYRPASRRPDRVKSYMKWRNRSMYYHYALAGEWKPLRGELAKLPKEKVKRTVPYVNMKTLAEDPEAATGLATKGELPESFTCLLFHWDAPPVEYRNLFERVLTPAQVRKAAGQGYRYYYLGTARLYPDSLVTFNFSYASGVSTGYLFDHAKPEQRYDFYLSLKLDADGKTLWCDELVLVESEKPSTLRTQNYAPGSFPRVYSKDGVLRVNRRNQEDPTGNN